MRMKSAMSRAAEQIDDLVMENLPILEESCLSSRRAKKPDDVAVIAVFFSERL
jgi:hypothetical protein